MMSFRFQGKVESFLVFFISVFFFLTYWTITASAKHVDAMKFTEKYRFLVSNAADGDLLAFIQKHQLFQGVHGDQLVGTGSDGELICRLNRPNIPLEGR